MTAAGDTEQTGRGVPLVPAFCAVMVAAVLALPANLVLEGPLRSIGSVSRMFGLLALGLVLLTFVRRDAARTAWGRRAPGAQLVPILFLLYLIASVGLVGAAYRRVMSHEEITGSIRVLVGTFALVGVGLAVSLFVRDRRGLHAVMGCAVAGAALSALVGIVQTRTPLEWAELVRPPGFVINVDLATQIRNGFTRVLGTGGHAIEFAVVLAGAVPIALYLATHAGTRLRRQSATIAAVLLLLAVPLGVSRAGVIGVVVAIVCYAVVWTWRQRATALAVAVIGVGIYRLVQPGVLGTIYSLIVNASTDNSVAARTEDYPRVEALLAGHQLLGIGPGTFQPAVYFVLDNQYLLSLTEGGVVGLLMFISLPIVGLAVATRARAGAIEKVSRDASQAVFASIAAMTACAATFDLMSFQQASFMLFVYVGLAGAVLNVAGGPAVGVRSADRAEVTVG